MLDGLDAWIANHAKGDLTIVLHQMGNHGPAYYKRYPDEFAVFSPVCSTNELGDCSDVEINNAYDNAILYTDYFLGEVINFLKPYDDSFETAMYYMSDHGESLGENGLYLHGLPYLLAPDTQKNVASIMWFGASYAVNHAAVAARTDERLSHDNYFHTVLGLMEIEASIYEPSMDLIVHR
jgi:lipid A ethanolaminephosphotransferase